MSAPILTDEIAAFLHRGVSLVAASRNANLQPSLARAYGCHVSPDRSQITLVLSASQSATLLADISTTGQIALAITEPTTHRTYQLKGHDAHILPLHPSDNASYEAHLENFVAEVCTLGYAEALLRAVMGIAIEDRVAVCFSPTQSFNQTPGAAAGARLA